MEAYLLLPSPLTPDEDYEFAEVMEKVRAAGVKIGINEAKISAMLQERYYDRECLIAKGIDVENGVDAYFDLNFDTNSSYFPTLQYEPDILVVILFYYHLLKCFEFHLILLKDLLPLYQI